jgi:hypothetical protein
VIAAGTPVYAPPAQGEQLLLYVSRPIGFGSRTLPVFGLRIERLTTANTSADLQFSAPQRHRPMVDLQLGPGSAPRVNLGDRLSWDLRRKLLEPLPR